MFCPNCGNQLPEGANTCPSCNQAVAQTAENAQPAQQNQPTYQDPAPSTERPAGKFQYFWKTGPKKFRIMNIVALALGLVCVLNLIISVNTFLNKSILEMSVVQELGDAMGVDLDELDEEYDDMMDMIDEALEDEDNWAEFEAEFGMSVEDLEDELEDQLGMDLEDFQDLFDPLSIKNLAKIATLFGGEDDPTAMILNALVSTLNGWMIFMVILTLLAMAFNKTWIAVMTYIFSMSLLALTGGAFAFLLASVCYITMAVLYSKMKMEYKFYLRGFGL